MLQTAFLGGLGGPELIVVFVVVLILFGPKRLPEVAKMFGKTMETLRKSANDFKSEIMNIEHDTPPLQSSVKSSGVSEQGYIDTEVLASNIVLSAPVLGPVEPVAVSDSEKSVPSAEIIKMPYGNLPDHAIVPSADGGTVQPGTVRPELEIRPNDRAG